MPTKAQCRISLRDMSVLLDLAELLIMKNSIVQDTISFHELPNGLSLKNISRFYKKAEKLEITQEDIEEKVVKAASDVRSILNCPIFLFNITFVH